MSRNLFLFLIGFGALFLPVLARAADYETVPADAPLYQSLRMVAQAGWASASSATEVNATTAPAGALTRYEIVLETAKAIFAVSARRQAEPNWEKTAPRPAVQALRELVTTLSPELQKLGIDVAQTQAALDEMLSLPPVTQESTKGTSLTAAWAESTAPAMAEAVTSSASVDASADAALEMPISERFRLYTALSTVARRDDPLDSNSWMAGAAGDGERTTEANATSTLRDLNGATGVANSGAGATLALTDWLRLRTEWNRRTQAAPPLFSDLSLGRTLGALNSQTALGGGVDIALGGVTLSGEMARIGVDENTPGAAGELWNGTRLGGGLGLSAWQNRLVLNANLARLVPETESAAEATTAELNLGFDLSENLRLRLLYQHLFSPQPQARAERVVAGGLSVQF